MEDGLAVPEALGGAGVTQAELAACTATLTKLSPVDLELPALAELYAAGKALFASRVIKERFQTEDVVAFLKQQGEYRNMVKRLEVLHKEVGLEHKRYVADATHCGINSSRLQRTKDVAQLGLPALSTAAEQQRRERCDALKDRPELPGAAGESTAPEPPLANELGARCPTCGKTFASAQALAGHVKFCKKARAGARAPEACEATEARGSVATVQDDDDAPQIDDLPATASDLKSAYPKGSFRRVCNICKQRFDGVHHFYHQLCPSCGDFNYTKRLASADLNGYVALLTGGRVRIGYQIALRLLRCGATVHVTSRFPNDAAMRFSLEHDAQQWRDRLHLYYLEMTDLHSVERFCDSLLVDKALNKLDILINNAAQTLTRPSSWTARMYKLEASASGQLEDSARQMIRLPSTCVMEDAIRLELEAEPEPELERQPEPEPQSEAAQGSAMAESRQHHDDAVVPGRSFSGLPTVPMDESGQPVDISGINSWSRRLADVSTSELLQTMAANAAAPFIMCSRLKPLLAYGATGGDDSATTMDADSDGRVVPFGQDPEVPLRSRSCQKAGKHLSAAPCSRCLQVSSRRHHHRQQTTPNLEGKFHVGKKSSAHPHTNMAKAALNMMTLTCAQDFIKDHILVNCVDTGWVTDMSPLGQGAKARTHQTHVGPPLDEEDGAARVLDPIFTHLADGSTVHGVFFKDYKQSSW